MNLKTQRPNTRRSLKESHGRHRPDVESTRGPSTSAIPNHQEHAMSGNTIRLHRVLRGTEQGAGDARAGVDQVVPRAMALAW